MNETQPSDSGLRERVLSGGTALEACLIDLGRHFKIPISAASIRANHVGEDDVTTPDQFILVAERFGLVAGAANLPIDKISATMLPVVLLMKGGHAVVCKDRAAEGGFVVVDPNLANVDVVIPEEQLAKEYSGQAIIVRAPYRPAKNPEVGTASLRGHWFWQPMLANRRLYGHVALAAALVNVLGLATAIFMMTVYNRVLPNEAFDSLIALTVGVALAIFFDFIIKMLRAAFIDKAGHQADLAIARRIFDQLLDMQMKNRGGSTGGLASMMREFETLREFFTSASLVALVDLPFTLLFVGVIYGLAGSLAIIPALAIPLVLIVGVMIQPMLAKLTLEAFDEGQTKQGVLVEAISGLETIKATGAAPLMRQRWEDSIRHQSNIGVKSRVLTQFALNATGFAQQAAQVSTIFFGVILIMDGQISMGALIASVLLIGRALAPLAQLAQTLNRLNHARTSYQSIDKIMNAPRERPEDRQFIARPHLDGKIEFKNVNFSYPKSDTQVLSDISFKIQPKEKVAILGRIGSGKSTIARMILNLYSPTSGSLHIDDTDIRQIDPADLRSNVSVVLQDIWLFSGTVRQNIAVGARHPDDEDILKAAVASGAHNFIANHPLGYDLVLGERGEGLSGGQRQSITLARALINDAPIMILDEPTSMMDMESEQEVLERLKAIVADKTFLIITHRISMLNLVDRVIVVDKGRIVADGPPSLVIKRQPVSTDVSPDDEESS